MEDAQAALVVLLKIWVILLDGVENMDGTKPVANVLSPTRVEETHMPCYITPTEHMTSDSGKSIKPTGDNVMEGVHHAIYKLILTVPSRFTNGEETHGNSGAPTQLVDVDHSFKHNL